MWGTRCSTLVRWRSLARPAGVCWRWRSSASSFSSGWMLRLGPDWLVVQRCRSGQAAQACLGNCTLLPGSNAIATPLGQVRRPVSKSRANSVLVNRPVGVAHLPRLAEHGEVLVAVADQGRGQVGPVDVQLGYALEPLRSTNSCLCHRCRGDEAEMAEDGLHGDPDLLVVSIDGGPDLGFAARSWAAYPGEDRGDHVVAEGEQSGDGTHGVGRQAVAPGSAGLVDKPFAAQLP